MNPTHLRVEGPVSNHHVERKVDQDITILKFLRAGEPTFQPDEFYARMNYNPARSTASNPDGETGLDRLPGGRFVISKRFHSVWLPPPAAKVCLIQVTDRSNCHIIT